MANIIIKSPFEDEDDLWPEPRKKEDTGTFVLVAGLAALAGLFVGGTFINTPKKVEDFDAQGTMAAIHRSAAQIAANSPQEIQASLSRISQGVSALTGSLSRIGLIAQQIPSQAAQPLEVVAIPRAEIELTQQQAATLSQQIQASIIEANERKLLPWPTPHSTTSPFISLIKSNNL